LTQIDVNRDGFVVDSALLSDAFDLLPDEIQSLMRSGEITSRSETGIDEDAGRARLTFHFRERAVRFVVDQSGAILSQARFPVPARKPIPGGKLPKP